MTTGRLVILSGPSGVGKDTVIDAWQLVNPDIERVVAYTTRDPRPGEVDGVAYWFVSRPEFLRMADANEFIEHKEVAGNFYATPARHTDRILSEGRIAILKIDVQGALEVMEKRPDSLSVFLLPPSGTTLRERLETRGTDSPETIARRLMLAETELAQADRYGYRIVNRDVSEVVARLQELTSP